MVHAEKHTALRQDVQGCLQASWTLETTRRATPLRVKGQTLGPSMQSPSCSVREGGRPVSTWMSVALRNTIEEHQLVPVLLAQYYLDP